MEQERKIHPLKDLEYIQNEYVSISSNKYIFVRLFCLRQVESNFEFNRYKDSMGKHFTHLPILNDTKDRTPRY